MTTTALQPATDVQADAPTRSPARSRSQAAALPENEAERLLALRELEQLDTPPDPVFDAVTRLVASLCDVPIALISLVDEHRQWFKSRAGLPVQETPRELAFCAHAILTPSVLMEVPDATKDARFSANALVTADPHIRFYAGAPLVTRKGFALGTLCAIDRVPRTLTAVQRERLRDLATVVVHVLETARTASLLERATADLTQAEQKFRLLFENAPIGMTLAGMDGHYVSANRPFYELIGYDEADLRTLTFASLTHPDDRAGDDELARRLRDGDIPSVRRRKRYVRRDGVAVHVDVRATIMRDEAGAPMGFISQVIDMTAERAAERQLRESKALLRSLVDSIPDAILSVDREGRLTKFNSRVAEEILRYYGVTIEPGMRILELGDEATRNAARDNHRRCLQGENLQFEWTLEAEEGSPRHLLMSHTPMVAEGEIFGAAIVVKDITARREMELSVLRSHRTIELLRAIAATANEALTSVDALRQILELVAKFGDWAAGHVLTVVDGRLESQKIWYLQNPEKLAGLREVSERLTFDQDVGLPGRVLATKRPVWMPSLAATPACLRAVPAAGVDVSSGFAFPVFVGSEVAAVVEFFSTRAECANEELERIFENVGRQIGRVVERERHVAEIRALSLTDELTGLYNRRGFMTLALHQLHVIARSKSPGALLYLDLDGLKRINDVLGHHAGDEAIATFATVLRQTFRNEDIVARLGGDEFVVWVNASLAKTAGTLERLTDNLARQNASRPPAAALSVSIGALEVRPDTTETLEAILVRADALMYEKKRARRAARG